MCASMTLLLSFGVRSRSRCEKAQPSNAWKEEIRSTAHGGERRESHELPAHGSLGNSQIERSVLRADDRVAFVLQLMEGRIVRPDDLRELELTDETCATDKGGNPAFNPNIGHVFWQMGTICAAATDHPVSAHVRGRIARVHSTDMRAQRHRISVGIHRLVVEVVVAQWVCAELGIVFLRCEDERSAATPATHHLGRNQLLFVARLAMAPKELAKPAHMLLQPPVRDIASIAREDFRSWQLRHFAGLVWISQEEFTGLDRTAGAGVRD